MLSWAVLAVVVVAANGCCAPDRWSAYQLKAGLELIKGSPKTQVGISKVYHDAASERSAEVIKYAAEGEKNGVKFISDHRNKRLYVINLKTNACTVRDVDKPFRRFCTDSFKYLYDIKLGYGDNSLRARGYYKEFGSKDGKYNVGHVYLVSDACIPLQGVNFGLGKLDFLTSTGWGSFSSEFDDSVFNPPSTCPPLSCSQKKYDVNLFDIIRNNGPLKYGQL
ncbi:uncharacterized protein LOC124288408 [Haliotis rubra]|uniref:uncharacterized protein LOC124288408 n=1 Tax=Haliotis rubra TaxID=36100 RepID=UPI001EE4FA98|nr:uncharacterized protein LOC124288408 [Haliotis rubra]